MTSNFFLKRITTLHQKQRLPHTLAISHSNKDKRHDLSLHFSKNIFCQNLMDGTPCSKCINCKKIEHGNHPDLKIFYPEKNEISIEEIKQLIKWLSIAPHESKHKVLHIHQAHQLNNSSSNALLKTLEEPPYFAHIALWSENQSRFLQTILSRALKCQLHNTENEDNNLSPEWSQNFQNLIDLKGSSALDDIFLFSKNICKQKEHFPYFFKIFYQNFKVNFQQSAMSQNSIHLSRMENFHSLILQAENALLRRYGNAQIWIERLLIEWKMLWNLKKN